MRRWFALGILFLAVVWDGDPGKAAKPSGRTGAAMVYDQARREMLLFGGSSGDALPDDLWAWNGKSWRLLTPPGVVRPPGRGAPNMVYDPARRRVLLFSGRGNINDLWEWDGRSWREITSAPFQALHATVVYDPTHRAPLVLGGIDASGLSKRITEYRGGRWTVRDNALPGTPLAAAFIPDGRLVVVIPQSLDSNSSVATMTWLWDGERWSRGELGPPLTSLHAWASAADGTIYIYEVTGDRPLPPSIHVRSPAGIWTQIRLAKQPAAYNGAAAYDPVRKRFVLFGGSAGGAQPSDTWEFDGKRWRLR